MQTVIETKGLCKVYGRQFAVDHLDLTVPEGSVYGFIGPNGAGGWVSPRRCWARPSC